MKKPDIQKRFGAEVARTEAHRLAKKGIALVKEGKRDEGKRAYVEAKAKLKKAKELDAKSRSKRT